MYQVVTDQSKRRRQILRTAVVATASLITGCERWSRMRNLSFRRFRVQRTETWKISGRVSVSSQGPDGWRTFHDVSVVAYDERDERINLTTLGAINGTTRDVEFTLSCEDFPQRIALEASESPCDADTSIQQYVYAGRDDGTRVWEQQDWVCDGGSNTTGQNNQ